ncbi:MAG: hypothetical protein MJ177_10650 [Clostridia bacterium]|nr:hypothetical protein [Clostridia bacterium]
MNKNKAYIDRVHTWGRIWSVTALLVLLCVPLGISVYYNVWPEAKVLLNALKAVIPIYWGTAVIEVSTYTPLLGAGGTYLSFVTGNISNLKMPCAFSAMERADVKSGSEEGEIVSTLAVGASAITTTVILAVGVLAFTPFIGSLTAEGSFFKPAFDNVLPALFGALLASYFAKHWRLTVLPIIAGTIVYIFTPALPTGTMIFVTIVASIGGALLMLKTGLVGKEKNK